MQKIEEIQQHLKNILSEKRYNHSVGTMKMAQNLAKQYGIDQDIATITGLVHDIAKELPDKQKLNYVQENNIAIDEIEAKNLGLLHAKIGANIAKNKYGFTKQMQNAITYHTTGNPQMDLLAKIIFIADKVEETRTYKNIEKVRELAYENIDECMLYILDSSIKKTIDKKKLIHPDSILTRNILLMK